MQIHKVILHKINKTGPKCDPPLQRDAVLTITDSVSRLVEAVRDQYQNKTSTVYGVFNQDQTNYPFQAHLTDYLRNESDESFVTFSVTSLDTLQRAMNAAPASRGGYVLFVHYAETGSDFLFVLMLHDTESAAVDEASLTVKDVTHLDIKHLYVAGRVNVTSWKAENFEGRYLNFVRGRREVSDYFVTFFGCTEESRPAVETGRVIDALNDYLRANDIAGEEKDRIKGRATEYIAERIDQGKEANLAALSMRINEEDPEAFQRFVNERDYEVSAHFRGDKKALRRLSVYRYQSDDFSIRIQQQYFRNHCVLDKEARTLKIGGLPDSLIEQMEND